jgi:uncharacterized protein (UPF0548 family)
VNLLAGRAFVYDLFPLTDVELADQFDIQAALTYGTLPGHLELNDPAFKASMSTNDGRVCAHGSFRPQGGCGNVC